MMKLKDEFNAQQESHQLQQEQSHQIVHNKIIMLAKESIRIIRPMTYLFTGPMEAGKTYHLMRTVQNLLGTSTPLPFDKNNQEHNCDVDNINKEMYTHSSTHDFSAAIFCKPKVDTRTTASTIASRNGTVFHSVSAVDSLDTIKFKENTLVAVDEAQFFDSSLLRLFDRVQDTPGCVLVVAGLDRDYEKQPFGYVLELAEKIVTSPGMGQLNLLRAPCHVPFCRTPAAFTKRVAYDAANSQIFIGGSESYVAACGKHHGDECNSH